MIDLKPFCSTDETRTPIWYPWSVGEWTYATDGKIIIRVLRIVGLEARDGCPWQSGINSAFAGEFLPEALLMPDFQWSPRIDSCICTGDLICDDCDNHGYRVGNTVCGFSELAAVGHHHISPYYLDKLRPLGPELRLFANVDPAGAVKFELPGMSVEGRLMGIRKGGA